MKRVYFRIDVSASLSRATREMRPINFVGQAKSNDNYTTFDISKKCILETIQHVTFERFNHWLLRRSAFFSVNCSKKEKESERWGKRRRKDRSRSACVRRRQTRGIGPVPRARCIDFVPRQTGCLSRLPALSRCAFLRIRLTDAHGGRFVVVICFPTQSNPCLLQSCFRT